MLDNTSSKNGTVQHSFRFLVYGSRPHSSNIPPGHHSESNPHSPAGHCRWDSPIPTIVLVSKENKKSEPFSYREKVRIFYFNGSPPGRHSYGSRNRALTKAPLGWLLAALCGRALRVAFADFSAAPWQGFEKSERGPNNSSLFLPQAAVVVVAVQVLLSA